MTLLRWCTRILGCTLLALIACPTISRAEPRAEAAPVLSVVGDDYAHLFCNGSGGNACITSHANGGFAYGVGSGITGNFTLPDPMVIQGNSYAGCIIKDLNAFVVLSQSSVGDLGAVGLDDGSGTQYLITPNLFSGCGSSLNAIFDDQSSNPSNCPATGNAVMQGSSPGLLANFNNETLSRTWYLAINNNGPSSGSVTDWGFAVKAQCTITPVGGGSCTNGATQVCLSNSRFKVTMKYQASGQPQGDAHANVLTSDTGWFWFFNSANAEVLLKVINGCGLNNRYWVFAGGLTDVRVVITVTDTTNGTFKTYTNNLGTAFQPIQDTSAFATCP